MFCSDCGQPIDENKAFCKECGAPIAAAAAGAPEPGADAGVDQASAAAAGAAEAAAGTTTTAEQVTTLEQPTAVEGRTVVESPTLVESRTVIEAATIAEARTVVAETAAAGDSPATLVAGAGLGTAADDSGKLPAVAEMHKVVPPPVPGVAAASPAPPAPSAPTPKPSPPLPPPPVYTGYNQLQASQGPGGRTALVIGIVLAVIIVLAGIGVAIFLVMRGGDTSSGATAGPVTTTAATSSTAAPTTAGPTSTPGPAVGNSTTADPIPAYLAAMDVVVAQLMGDDARIPVLADQINATAPGVPRGVYDDLQVMLGKLDAASTELAAVPVPGTFAESDKWLKLAIRYMGERIYATIQGLDAMYTAGTATAATAFFDQGRVARDNFQTAFQQFQDSVPID